MSYLSARTLSEGAVDFIDDQRLEELLKTQADGRAVRDVIAKSMEKQPLSVEETAVLLTAETGKLIEEIFSAAHELKKKIYGNRIVLFAPLYVGNDCLNDCRYCGFRRSNPQAIRHTLSDEEIIREVAALVQRGHKRIIIVFGEHPDYNPEYIADCIHKVYSVRAGHGNIRRVNVNAAPMEIEGYRIIKAAGIGAYQIFQETYHHATYAVVHPPYTLKADFLYRLDGQSRAMEAGCGDVGIGALFGLYDWRYEVLGLVSHALYLQDRYGVGPHTISFPRLQPACGVRVDERYLVDDEDFKRLIAVLRLAVPYTGLILTARERAELRRQAIAFGVSQIDAGSRIEIGGYTQVGDSQVMEREQFQLGDIRSLDEVIRELLAEGYVPSFCTSCYRLGRTGEHFMEFAKPGFIQRFCTPNAISTLMEYLVDYASPETRAEGEKIIAAELTRMAETPLKRELVARLDRIRKSDDRDLYF